MQTGHESLARTEGYEIFERHNVEDIARTAAGRALAAPASLPPRYRSGIARAYFTTYCLNAWSRHQLGATRHG